MRVLVVEDAEPVRQRLLSGLRRSEGVEAVAGARSGEEGLDMAGSFDPDLIILDLMMPGMSGLEVLEALRTKGVTAKVIVLTNYPYPAFRRRCMELGASHFYGKPTEFSKFINAAMEVIPQTADFASGAEAVP